MDEYQNIHLGRPPLSLAIAAADEWLAIDELPEVPEPTEATQTVVAQNEAAMAALMDKMGGFAPRG